MRLKCALKATLENFKSVLSYGSGNLTYQLPISKLETANADLIEAVVILKNENEITSARFNSGSGQGSKDVNCTITNS